LEYLLAKNATETQKMASSSFFHLCSLTNILGEILPLVYSLRTEDDGFWKAIRRLECSLDDWEDKLPKYLSWESANSPGYGDGSCSLWFCYLSVRLLLHRLPLKVRIIQNMKPHD
jgi:hypothetical protein